MFYILFLFVYLFLTAGVTITSHFCGGELYSISLIRGTHDPVPCGCDHSSCCNPCCSDEIKTIKIEDTYTFESKTESDSTDEFIIAEFADYSFGQIPASDNEPVFRIPPNLSPHDIPIFNSSFLI